MTAAAPAQRTGPPPRVLFADHSRTAYDTATLRSDPRGVCP